MLGYDQNSYESLFCYFFVLSSAYIRKGCSVFLRNKLSLVYCVVKSFLFFPTMDIDLLKVNHVNLFMCSFSFFLSFTLLQNSVYGITFYCLCCCCSCLFFITSTTNWYQELKLRSREFKILI